MASLAKYDSDTLVTIVRRLALFGIILMSGGHGLIPRVPLLAVTILLIGICVVVQRRKSQSDSFLVIFGLLGAILLINLTRPGGVDLETLAIRYANFLAAAAMLFVYMRGRWSMLADDLRVILRPMAWQSVVTLVVATAIPVAFVTIEFEDALYYTIGGVLNYHAVGGEGATGFPRPNGFFFEPGVFQFYLNLYLFLVLFVFKRFWHAPVAVIAVFATQSTTGVLIAFALMGIAYLRISRRVSAGETFLVFLAALVIAVPTYRIAASNLNTKLSGDLRGSGWAREYDLYTGLGVIERNPWIGIGFEYERYYEEASQTAYLETQLDDATIFRRGNTNGLIFLSYAVGIPLALVFLWGLLRQRFFYHRVLIAGIVGFSLFSESIVFTPFFLMFMFSGLLLRRRRPRDKEMAFARA